MKYQTGDLIRYNGFGNGIPLYGVLFKSSEGEPYVIVHWLNGVKNEYSYLEELRGYTNLSRSE
jgi:hypothetical protein